MTAAEFVAALDEANQTVLRRLEPDATLTPEDWSERRYHVAGHVGAEICRRCLELGWLQRRRDTRALRLTPAGAAGLADTFGVTLGGGSEPAVRSFAQDKFDPAVRNREPA